MRSATRLEGSRGGYSRRLSKATSRPGNGYSPVGCLDCMAGKLNLSTRARSGAVGSKIRSFIAINAHCPRRARARGLETHNMAKRKDQAEAKSQAEVEGAQGSQAEPGWTSGYVQSQVVEIPSGSGQHGQRSRGGRCSWYRHPNRVPPPGARHGICRTVGRGHSRRHGADRGVLIPSGRRGQRRCGALSPGDSSM